MKIRWWRIGVVYEDGGVPHTKTFHVRALQEKSARALVDQRVALPHTVFACAPSEPLLRVKDKEEIVAEYGPYARSWDDPDLKSLKGLL